MITGEVRSQVDKIWDAFWTGGISNPLEVIEQITYLLFLKRLDDLHTLEENKANRTKKSMENRIFPKGKDAKKRSYDDLRWSRFKHFEPKEMFEVLAEHVFPFLRTLGGDGSTYTKHMKDARFTIPTPGLLAKVVDMIDQGADGRPGHQGRLVRVHAGQNRDGGTERTVSDAAPHHPIDGGNDEADTV